MNIYETLKYFSNYRLSKLCNKLNNNGLLFIKIGNIFILNELNLNKIVSFNLYSNKDLLDKFFNTFPKNKICMDLSSEYFSDKIDTNLNGLRKLNLSNSHIINLDGVKNIIDLNLSYSQKLSNLSSLCNVYNLDLTGCLQIKDVSMLGNIYKLNLSYCLNVSDVSMLGNVYDLNLSSCYKIIDVSMLGNVHTLNLNNCLGIIDVSALGNVYNLNLSNCYNVSDVSMLENVNNLILNSCDKIKNKDIFIEI
jgi:hypothetical protein